MAPDDIITMLSPSRYSGRHGFGVDTIILHYTAGRGNAIAAARVFANPSRKASAHFVIGRDGGVVQCVNLPDGAWHAGDKGLSRLPPALMFSDKTEFVELQHAPHIRRSVNCRSIGIELCNRGWAPRGANPYVAGKHPGVKSELWESYSDQQIEALQKIIRECRVARPTLRFICGHEDVTNNHTLDEPGIDRVGGKSDPGPAFPWERLRGCGLRRLRYDYHRRGWAVEKL